MSVVATVVVFVATVTGLVLGQVVDIASDLDSAGRNFSCTGEVVTYTCNGQGTIVFVSFPPLLNNSAAFIPSDPVPDVQVFPTLQNVILTLTVGMPNYSVNLQIAVPGDPQQMRINVSCSTDISGSLNNFVLPLIHESQIEPPSTVTLFGLTGDTTRRSVQVSWTSPMNPQFDIDYYLVNIYVDGVLHTTRSSRDNSLDVDVPSGKIVANVRIVTTCGSISAARLSDGSISGKYSAFYAAFLVPTLICVFLIIVIVLLLAIFLVRAHNNMKDTEKRLPERITMKQVS